MFMPIVSLLSIVPFLQLVSFHSLCSMPPAPAPECFQLPQTPPGLFIHWKQQLCLPRTCGPLLCHLSELIPHLQHCLSAISCVWDILPGPAGLAFLSFILFSPQMPSYRRSTLPGRKKEKKNLTFCLYFLNVGIVAAT